jgi:hypothetical protein
MGTSIERPPRNWLSELGSVASLSDKCERSIEGGELLAAVRFYLELEAAVYRYSELATAKPRCHRMLVEDLRRTLGHLAARIRTLRELPPVSTC